MSNARPLTNENFDSVVNSGVALVDFWAEWCGPCRMLGPVLDQVAAELGDSAVVAKVNVDEAQELAARFGVRSIPALFVFKDGAVVDQFVGVQDKTKLVNAVRKHLGAQS
jgi:thioredoxin 1